MDKVALISFHTCPLAAPGEGKAGGMNVYVRELSRYLGGMGIRVDVFTRCHAGQEADIVELGSQARVVHLKGGPPRQGWVLCICIFLPSWTSFIVSVTRKVRIISWCTPIIGFRDGWGRRRPKAGERPTC